MSLRVHTAVGVCVWGGGEHWVSKATAVNMDHQVSLRVEYGSGRVCVCGGGGGHWVSKATSVNMDHQVSEG